MYKIVKKEKLSPNIILMDVEAPMIATSAKPGQFIILKTDKFGERIPLTICDYDAKKGTVTIVTQTVGDSTKEINEYDEGGYFHDFVGPLGNPTEFINEDIETLKKKKILFVAGGLGTAPVYPQVKWLHEQGVKADVIIGARSKDYVIMEEEMKKVAGNVYVTTDDGSYGEKGLVTDVIKRLVTEEGKKYDEVVAIGPMVMMKFVSLLTKELNIPTVVSLNPVMVDGTGMCGACRVSIGGKTKFACVDGPEFDAHQVNFDEAIRRQNMYRTPEGKAQLEEEDGDTAHRNGEKCGSNEPLDFEFDKKKKTADIVQNPEVRKHNFEEVSKGYTKERAMMEATRCLNCKKPLCVGSCPVEIDIPGFIMEVKNGNFEMAARVLAESSALPAVCGRVCPQEDQCEGSCIVGIKNEPVGIGRLERFVADHMRHSGKKLPSITKEKNGIKVAVVGSGPAGITCAGDLAKMGYDVTVFEALHEPGGVLMYGIPEFRLPKDEVVKQEIQGIIDLGVKIITDAVIGRTITVDELLGKEGFKAVFIGSGAGLPKFMNIPGENSNGVLSANELLTRSNLMKAIDERYKTPLEIGKRVAVVGAGNVAMDAARTALRLGSEVYIVYRRSEEEAPARVEEVEHAKEEGINFMFLTNPVEIIADENGWVKGMKCIKMELGEPDESGRRSPKEIEGSEFTLDLDTVVISIGTSPNPLISMTTPGLETNKWECLIADEGTGKTTKHGVYAGGDAVTGAATVIQAMGAGKEAAKAIDKYLSEKK